MPPAVNANDLGHGVNNWYTSLPPITRIYGTTLFGASLLLALQMLNPFWLALIWSRVVTHFEVWRLLGNFLFLGKFGMVWLAYIVRFFMYSPILEGQVFLNEPADYLTMLLFGAGAMLVASGLAHLVLGMPLVFNALGMIFMIVTVWSRNFAEQAQSVYGLFTIQSYYMPYFYLVLDIIMGGGAISWPSVVGIGVGHLYYHLHDVYPLLGGPQLLATPRFLKNLLADWGLGRRAVTHAASGQESFRSFAGRGRRLGTS
ncbi:hypothetical protein PLESTB_001485000 [Pleodorina starrii]|uniref:Derlin n=1 Tax=Pleodorina starrii TaxID=330485 RepID=A0A9W6F7Q4_9CHLO|nr:hypothetical protein PLESTM_000656800 [Pleodorina starrii]GLC59428.1 hypothetical protein PLESTB_001485000 [Pleodorina starrii]GLC74376.1 hypothetical protein PLESTF_001506500 [Pleodorina starrii]